MKKGKAEYFYSKNIEYDNREYYPKRNADFERDYQLYTSSTQKQGRYDWTRDVGCQCGAKSNIIGYSAPKHTEVVYYGDIPKQMYAYTRAKSFTNVGVGNVIVQQRKRVRKIYLPETVNRGVGSSDLSTFFADRKPRYERDNYYHFDRKTSSKCVGGVLGIRQCTEKLSPISCYNNSKGTSPSEIKNTKKVSKDIGNNTIDKNLTTTTTQVESFNDRSEPDSSKQIEKQSKIVKDVDAIENVKSLRSTIKKFQGSSTVQKSSDSLEQHVHNLEDPSFIQSTGSSDPMENKLEKEYRNIFSSKNKEEKPMHELKSTSLLRRRFEALKRGMAKKDDSKKNSTTSKESSPVVKNSDAPVQRDISVESDPPSLEARSISHTKMFSPPPSVYKREGRAKHPTRKKSYTSKKDKEGIHWPPKNEKADDADVKGMFKMWGEKFDFDDDKKLESPDASIEQKKKTKIKDGPKTESDDKKEGKRFFFFRKKSKDKDKSPVSKKGVTTGRCEVKNCTVLNRRKSESKHPQKNIVKNEKKQTKAEENDEILKKHWLKNFIQRTIESRKSLQIRWNNKTYTTSSSTVFELMDNLYRQADVVIRSQSETSTGTSSYYQSHHKHRVNFVQDIEAWMIPNLIPHRNMPYNFFRRNEGHSRIPDRKWFIDKSKAFAHEIELVLNSKNFVRFHRAISSDYLQIDIPKGFFTDQSSDSEKFATSNSEEVYKIIEYESPESRSEFRIKVNNKIGDFSHNDMKITKKVSVRDKDTDTRAIETVIKKPPVHRDVVIQGSNVYIPKRCDVIGVGIITHHVNRYIGKSIMDIEDNVSEEESEHLAGKTIKQCQFAESYLRDDYRNWMPLGMDLFPTRASDMRSKYGESVETLTSLHNQGDGTKSCPNILTDYGSGNNLQPSTDSRGSFKDTQMDQTKIFNTFKSTTKSEPPLEAKRILPKDSFEVLRKRMLYACGNKSRWIDPDDKPYSVPSIEDKAEQGAINETCRTCNKCNKRVSMPKCGFPCESDQSSHVPRVPPSKNAEMKPHHGILSPYLSKSNKSLCSKHATISDEHYEIPSPPCMDYCKSVQDPFCSKPPSKKSSSSSNSSSKSKKSSTKSPIKNKSATKTILPKNLQRKCLCSCSSKLSTSSKSSPITEKNSSQMGRAKKPCPCSPKPMKQLPKLPKPCTCSPKDSKTNKERKPKKRKNLSEKPSQNSCNGSMSPQQSQTRCCQGQSKNIRSPQSPCPCTECLKKSRSQVTTGSQDCPPKLPPISLKTSSDPITIKPSIPEICPGSPCETALDELAKKIQSLPKVQGVHLKMKPVPFSPKCVSDCPASASDEKLSKNKSTYNETCDLGCPSDEKLLIRVKEDTASTEEIREGLNIRVQDADGKTLYERRDYKANCGVVTHKSSVLGEMYKVNRVSTANVDQLNELNVNKSLKEDNQKCANIANMIEISFGLKVTQGDKIAEINLNGVNDEPDKLDTKEDEYNNENVFIVNSEAETKLDDPDDKNDINIKIVIKNFDTSKKQESKDVSPKIIQKYHTVSTGYSDILTNYIDDMYSIHRTTIDLTASKSQPQPNLSEDERANEKITIENMESKGGTTRESLSKLKTYNSDNHSIVSSETTQISRTLQRSETYEVVNRSRESTLNCNTFENSQSTQVIKRQNSMTNTKMLPDVCSIMQKSITSEKTLTVDINDMPISLEKNEVCKEIQMSEMHIKKMFSKTSYNSENTAILGKSLTDQIKTVQKLEALGLESTNNNMLMGKKTNSDRHSFIKNNTMHGKNSKIEETQTGIPLQKSEKNITNTSNNDGISKSTKRKSETDKNLLNTGNYDVLDNNNNKAINESSESIEIECEESSINNYILECESGKSKSDTEITMQSIEHSAMTEINSKTKKIESFEVIHPKVEEPLKKSSTYNDKPVSKLENQSHTEKPVYLGQEELVKPISEIKKYNTFESVQKFEVGEAIPKAISEYTKIEKTVTEGIEQNESQCNKIDDKIKQLQDSFTFLKNVEFSKESLNKLEYNKQQTNIGDIKNDDARNETNKSETLFSHTDTDEQDDTVELTNTSDDANGSNVTMNRPYTKKEKKEMLKQVFEKATSQKWKTKGSMKRLKNILKFILKSDSDVDEVDEISKELLKDFTLAGINQPNFFKGSDSMTNYYRVGEVLQSDEEIKIHDQSECSDASDYQESVSKCPCHNIAERLNKHAEIFTGGCCCKSSKVHEQTSCNINNDLFRINYKTSKYMDVQTQHSVINSRITNVMLLKKMESVMTSMRYSDFEKLKENGAISSYKGDKECEVKNVTTNTVVGLLDDGKIVIRTSDSNQSSLKTEIFIGWKGKDKKRQKECKPATFSNPADILQSYETKKAVLEIYTENTITKEGERLVAKLPKFVYDKESEIEKKYVKNLLLLHDSS